MGCSNGNFAATVIDIRGLPDNLDITPLIGLLTSAGSNAVTVPEPHFDRLRCTGPDDRGQTIGASVTPARNTGYNGFRCQRYWCTNLLTSEC